MDPSGTNTVTEGIGEDAGFPRIAPLPWPKRIIRYVLHLAAVYMVLRFSTNTLADFLHLKILPAILGEPAAVNALQFLPSHLLSLSVAPAFLAGLLINAKFRHGFARWVWIVPVVILVFAFLFVGPGMYPTMLWESDFAQAFHYFFGGLRLPQVHNLQDITSHSAEWMRAYDQLRFASPAYAGVAYSLGAWLGMARVTGWLQSFMARL